MFNCRIYSAHEPEAPSPPASAVSKPRLSTSHLRRAVRSLHGAYTDAARMAGSRHSRRLTTSHQPHDDSAPCEGGRAMVAMMERETITPNTVLLDPDQKSPRAQEFEEKLAARIVGQERAVRRMSGLYQIFLAGMNPPNRPVGTMIFLGPTGSGKTRVVEAAAEVLFGDPNAVIKIDCAEFQHSHEIAKLIGSPPGYLGHRETSPMLTQEYLDRMHTKDTRLSLVLFDEIEK